MKFRQAFLKYIGLAGLFLSVSLGPGLDAVAFEKVGVTSFQFLKVMPGARSTGVGEAYSSIVDGADAMYWNPAALTRVSRLSVNASHVDWFLDTGHNSFTAAYNIGRNVSLGLMALNADYGSIEVTTVDALGPVGDGYNPGLTGETITPGATAFGIGFGHQLTNKFSYGLTGKYVTEDMVVRKKSLLMFDGGIYYHTGFRSVQMSATLRHFGPEVTYYDKSYSLPQTMNVGISAYVIGQGDYLFFNARNQNLLMAFDIVQPRDYDQQYNLGAEYSISDILFLRAGYKINYDTAGLTLGFGVQYANFAIDYSFNDHDEFLGNVNRFSVGYNL
ncbi:MAG: PorV/PorQ family protein [Candidatus Marinimicrobia bacterium]|nr:PorV/PorQ family protein [Candidatus Neomarinimicrobiota bacterium]MCF7828922.1 PorV/PorQ family protein [Candidatus Neomarinimicrobiota bacterium]MCF7879882.1 PorV/PorQ family protein [Candidatus Neomarinimicrobiota bacterium]